MAGEWRRALLWRKAGDVTTGATGVSALAYTGARFKEDPVLGFDQAAHDTNAQDILKLALLKREVGREQTQTIIALASAEARDSISGWLREAARTFGVELSVVEISEELRAKIRDAQARQVMVNLDHVTDDLGVSEDPP